MTLSAIDGYNDRLLVPGSIVGARAWDIEPFNHRLEAIGGFYRWTPGVNEAEHEGGVGSLMQRLAQESQTADVPEHVIAGRNCCCGFWGVWKASSVPTGGGEVDLLDLRIRGLIRASGTVTVGTTGFRAAKAEVIALVPPPWVPPVVLRDRCACRTCTTWGLLATGREHVELVLGRSYPDVPWFPTLAEAIEQFPLTDPHPLLHPEVEP